MLKLAYLLSRYPAVSHTFFLQEVEGLRALGLDIQTAAINTPDRPIAQLSVREQQAAQTTFYVKSSGTAALAVRALYVALRHPAAAWRAVRTASSLPGLNLRTRMQWLLYAGEALLVGKWMQKTNCTHLHVHFGGPVASVGMLTAAAWKVPYSLTIHGPEEFFHLDTTYLIKKVQAASFVLCISHFCRSQLQQKLPVEQWSKLHINRLGVRDDLLHPAPLTTPQERAIRICCTGRLVREKGQHVLLQAIARANARGCNLQLVLVGSGPEQSSLQQLAAQLDITSVVQFRGALSHPETLEVVKDSHIFALASFAEGVPVALMEAMAIGVPTVSTFIAGIPELIRNEMDGLLVPASDVEALTTALERIAADEALRASLIHSARARVSELYSLTTNHHELAALYQSLLAQENA